MQRAFGSTFFARYLLVGAIVFVIDIGLFELFLMMRFALWIGTSVAFGVSLVAHFFLNKYVSFRASDRTIFAQAATYLTLQIPMLILTAAVVEFFTVDLHAPPLVAKFISIAINLPLGYLSHRYLTFSAGIAAMVRRMRTRRRESEAISTYSGPRNP